MCEYMEKRWLYNEAPAETVGILCEKLHISTVLATAMVNRGITDPAAGNRFLYDTVESLTDPFLLSGTEKAVPRILDALAKGEKIVVYGDYDVDGITSTALVYQILSDLGGDPVFYIPERQTEGYGLNREALEELIKERTDLIVTVDCGISSVELIEEFKDKTDIIITDHHEPSDRIPDAERINRLQQVINLQQHITEQKMLKRMQMACLACDLASLLIVCYFISR